MENIYSEINIYWDIKNQVPIILNERIDKDIIKSNNYNYMGTDFRPVFLEEKWLLINLFPELFSENLFESSVWISKHGKYVIDGNAVDISPIKRANKIKVSSFREKILNKIFDED
ncbi:MAG: hypothetical protein ACRC0V_08825, partial [Fusobacteriaceae bacterium]